MSSSSSLDLTVAGLLNFAATSVEFCAKTKAAEDFLARMSGAPGAYKVSVRKSHCGYWIDEARLAGLSVA